jgi:putative ABC transport system permease protein
MILHTRWSKIFKDMWGSKSRSLLVIFSIAVGVAAVGMINNAANIIRRDLLGPFQAGNPALLQIFVSPFQEDLSRAVEGMREIETVQARRVLGAQLITGAGEQEDLSLNVVPDYNDIQVNRFAPVSGSAAPRTREILLERRSAEAIGAGLGDRVTVELAGERRYTLTVAGIVHDVYVMPFSLMGEATGYVNMDTLVWMGEEPAYNRLDIIVAEHKTDKEQVLATGELVRDRVIEPSGYQVGWIQIPGIGSDPGEHWAQNQMNGFLLILQVMSWMAIFLSGGLIVNTVSAILSQQIKQIGILRSVGAVRAQIVGMYLVNVLVFSVAGLAIAIPLGLLGSRWLGGIASSFLNFDLTQVDLPLDVALLQAAIGLLMPLGVATIPVLAGTRIPVYDAIYQYGLGDEEYGGRFEKLLSKVRSLNPPVMLSIRNTFRKKARLIFTLVTLTLAGAMFIAVFSTRASLTAQINQIGRYIYYDAALGLPAGTSIHTARREALRIPGVRVAEGWASAVGVIERADGGDSQELDIIGLPAAAQTIDPLIQAGTWLQPGNLQQVVINEDLLDEEPWITVGSEIEIKVGERARQYQVAGIASKHLSGPRIYMDTRAFGSLTGRHNQASSIRVLLVPGSPGSAAQQDEIARQLEERFHDAGLSQGTASTRHDFFERFTEVFDIILIVLVIMAALLAIVGGLGLTGAMGMNVLERTREIGVLRSLGASNLTVQQVVVIEGVMVGLISWVASAALSGPSGRALAGAVIEAVLQADLSFHYSVSGLLLWLALVVLIGVFSSLAPAFNASRLKVREVLDYE